MAAADNAEACFVVVVVFVVVIVAVVVTVAIVVVVVVAADGEEEDCFVVVVVVFVFVLGTRMLPRAEAGAILSEESRDVPRTIFCILSGVPVSLVPIMFVIAISLFIVSSSVV